MSTDLFAHIQSLVAEAVQELYSHTVPAAELQVQPTKKEFEGDLTLVVFPLVRFTRQSPEQTGSTLGAWLKERFEAIDSFNVIKGFLNLRLTDSFWAGVMTEMATNLDFAAHPSTGRKVVVEYCGPNTNKPLHLGHIRNMVLGYSMAGVLQAAGDEVHKVNIYNDRGIAICKSMVAWQLSGKGETPESSGMKGDHLIGKYYVAFANRLKQEVEELVAKGMVKEEAERQAPIQQAAQEMLRQWEAGDPEVLALWKRMNDWVYTGFNVTYAKLGVDFEKDYYESDTYLDGRTLVEEGLKAGVFFKKDDGSVWVDLTDLGLDEKVLLRSDGTSVYLTQDLGTAERRYHDFGMNESIYVVANEQEYHFKALQATLKKLGKPFADGIYHLSYGMVDLPTGKMKSREGTTVDADDLYDEMIATATAMTNELGKAEGLGTDEAATLYRTIGLGALKYYLLRVHPKKRILFDPQESIQFQGDTGPFIQYTHARIRSVVRKWEAAGSPTGERQGPLSDLERELIILLYRYPGAILEAAREFDPSHLATYAFHLAKQYNRFYAEHPILQAETPGQQHFRVQLSMHLARVLKHNFGLLGIDVPEVM